MIYSFGGRVDNDSNAITVLDEENETAVTTGYVNGEYVEFSGGSSSDFSTASLSIVDISLGNAVIYPSVVTMGDFDVCVANQGNGGTHPVVLYQGKAGVMVQAESYTLSGDATDMGEGMVLVTGDCTITLGNVE